jgi:hypothetical protein
MRCGLLAVALSLAACASQPPPAVAPVVPRSTASSAQGASFRLAASDLVGTWVEFWSVSGHADTQRYAFFEDGRFEWNAAGGVDAKTTRRWGTWKLERPSSSGAAGTALALLVQGHEERFGCEGSASCRVVDEPQIEERLPLGDCPANEEAKTLDASYRCVSIGAQAFWRHMRAHEPRSAP